MGQKVSVEKLRDIKTGDGRPLYSSHFEQVLLDVQNRSYEQYPWLAEGLQSCTVTDNFLPDNPIIWINDEFEKMTLYPKEEILGRNCRFLQGKATSREAVADIKAALALGSSIQVELLNYRKDGVAFFNDFQILPVYARQVTVPRIVTHFIAIQIDVTHLKETGKYFEGWSPAEVGSWLVSEELGDMSRVFLKKGIHGYELAKLNKEDIEAMGFSNKEALSFVTSFEKLKKRPTEANNKQKETPRLASMKNSVAIKCFLDDCIQVFTIPKSTSLKDFSTSVKRAMGSSYLVHFAGNPNPATKEEWKSTLKNASQTILVKLNRKKEKESKASSSGKSVRRSLETSPSGSSSDTTIRDSESEFDEENPPSTPGSTRLFRSESTAIASVFINVKKLLEGEEEALTQFATREGVDSKEVADALLNLYSVHGKSPVLFRWVVNTEIMRKFESSNTFLRGNNIQAKIFTSLFTNEQSNRYLQKILAPTMERVVKEESLELDTAKGVSMDDALKRSTWIAKEIGELIGKLKSSINSCPLAIREAMLEMKKGLDAKYPQNSTLMLISVFFLKFLVPAILEPVSRGLIQKESITSSSPSNFRIFAKLLQTVANDSLSEGEKGAMVPIQVAATKLHSSLTSFFIKLCSKNEIQSMREMMDASITISPKMKEESLLKLKLAVAESQKREI
eukprot:TRINITY_DN1863_c0_g1_i1.p1 TRINITY_DN1863_c0_g1~~TRINITY_DN1863_c0_g1_i1.p1  ORF type:complete len:679 (+),score=232.69 TRINITY_DN1863_c0_g1_i1:125-2161(+)